jgi:hypothetical protein
MRADHVRLVSALTRPEALAATQKQGWARYNAHPCRRYRFKSLEEWVEQAHADPAPRAWRLEVATALATL